MNQAVDNRYFYNTEVIQNQSSPEEYYQDSQDTERNQSRFGKTASIAASVPFAASAVFTAPGIKSSSIIRRAETGVSHHRTGIVVVSAGTEKGISFRRAERRLSSSGRTESRTSRRCTKPRCSPRRAESPALRRRIITE